MKADLFPRRPVSHVPQAAWCLFMGFHTKMAMEMGEEAGLRFENMDFSSLKLSWLLPT